MTQTEGAPHSSLADLVEVMRRLRDPENGCEWDRVQTFETIAPYAIEEAYEVADAIRRGDMAALKEELRSEEHTTELKSIKRLSYAVFCLKKKKEHTVKN